MRIGLFAAVLLAAGTALAQGPKFDVASLKPSDPVPPGRTYSSNLGEARRGEVKLTNCTLADCIRFAWSLATIRQVSGPDWIRNREIRFDIFAKAPAGSSEDALLTMLQNLLIDRFQMALHHEPKQMEHYWLTIAKNGPKLKAVEFDPNTAHTTVYGRGRLAHNQASMNVFLTLLSRQLDLPVIDKTGLKGYYAISLEWAPDPPPGGSLTPDESNRPSLSTALQDQLGLKLERDKSLVDSIVVDRALQTPLAN